MQERAQPAPPAEPPCSPFSGPAQIKSAKGILKLAILPSSSGCVTDESAQSKVTLKGTVKVLGGTGSFKKAKGTLKFKGAYDRSSGAFSVKLFGPLSY